MDGDRVVIGAPGADVGGNEDQGAAYVHVLETTGYVIYLPFAARDCCGP